MYLYECECECECDATICLLPIHNKFQTILTLISTNMTFAKRTKTKEKFLPFRYRIRTYSWMVRNRRFISSFGWVTGNVKAMSANSVGKMYRVHQMFKLMYKKKKKNIIRCLQGNIWIINLLAISFSFEIIRIRRRRRRRKMLQCGQEKKRNP